MSPGASYKGTVVGQRLLLRVVLLAPNQIIVRLNLELEVAPPDAINCYEKTPTLPKILPVASRKVSAWLV